MFIVHLRPVQLLLPSEGLDDESSVSACSFRLTMSPPNIALDQFMLLGVTGVAKGLDDLAKLTLACDPAIIELLTKMQKTRLATGREEKLC